MTSPTRLVGRGGIARLPDPHIFCSRAVNARAIHPAI
jgi:hypothetical protein